MLVVLHQGAYLSPEIIRSTTRNYYPDEENIDCVFSNFEDEEVKVYIQYGNR